MWDFFFFFKHKENTEYIMYYYIEAPPVVQKRIQRQKRIYELECFKFSRHTPHEDEPFSLSPLEEMMI